MAEAVGPLVSRPDTGDTPSASGSPASRQSAVAPVAAPSGTLAEADYSPGWKVPPRGLTCFCT
ncbi:hypothetical protein P9747_11200, partial [Paenibacillus macerans]|uniref:hypothetical protein n=1 Tax=Paenibacillus macerans TaxID=44252 RepID=UPI002E2224A3|nr:hypothetical protein [Paenibacillus macerans]